MRRLNQHRRDVNDRECTGKHHFLFRIQYCKCCCNIFTEKYCITSKAWEERYFILKRIRNICYEVSEFLKKRNIFLLELVEYTEMKCRSMYRTLLECSI